MHTCLGIIRKLEQYLLVCVFPGEIIHSVKYKDVAISGYEKKNVVLVGIGNSSVDIADNLVAKGRYVLTTPHF